MNRRNFIKYSSLTAAGGALASGLPLWAAGTPAGDRHVVLCVVAGIAKDDFISLFPKALAGSLGKKGRLITDFKYNGQAAGHRLALESILQGRYLYESESGNIPLTATALFAPQDPADEKYLLTADREFLKTTKQTAPANAHHFYVGKNYYRWDSHTHVTRLHASIKNAYPASTKTAEPYEMWVNDRANKHKYEVTASEDLLVAETACAILEIEQPRILVAHFMGADAAHFNADQAHKNRESISIGIQRMWETVCKQPALKETLFVVVPDFGRNGETNTLAGTDHSIADENTKRTACLLAAPHGLPYRLVDTGESTDILPTLSDFLAPGHAMQTPGNNLLRPRKKAKL